MDKFVKAEDVKDLLNGLDSLPWEDEVESMVDGLVVDDVEKVRHGYWKEETEYYDDDWGECNVREVFECSLCGRTERRKEPYCNCGAKMDLE